MTWPYDPPNPPGDDDWWTGFIYIGIGIVVLLAIISIAKGGL